MAFQDKVVLVTGSGGGLGLSIAAAFLAQSASLILVDINSARLESALANLNAAPSRVLTLTADITTEDAVKGIFFASFERFGKVDVLVNNAGIADRFDPVGTCEIELWDRVMAVNLTAVMLLSKHFVDHALSRDPAQGVILNVGSVGGERGGRAGMFCT